VVAFQPHRYSRTKALLPEFFPVFGDAPLVFITEIYSAGEPALPGISGKDMFRGIARQGHPGVIFVEDLPAFSQMLPNYLRPGDLFLTMGAGDIWKVGEELLKRLSQTSSPNNSQLPGETACQGLRARRA